MSRPFIDVICTAGSWADVLGVIKERQRFTWSTHLKEGLVSRYGRPLALSTEGFDMHLYPPGREALTEGVKAGSMPSDIDTFNMLRPAELAGLSRDQLVLELHRIEKMKGAVEAYRVQVEDAIFHGGKDR